MFFTDVPPGERAIQFFLAGGLAATKNLSVREHGRESKMDQDPQSCKSNKRKDTPSLLSLSLILFANPVLPISQLSFGVTITFQGAQEVKE